ncbi:TPA: T4SS guanine nucleotide exchange effector RalF [Legionella pneumophila]|uniref:T4SS guanine nucleotide exchange effector RalF n=1 Tax=Legionella pneumophila TaxID=446 RepID=UPI000787E6B8|nr:T4SS guanine nucleotide exchange effector RalF [Legionella pneumophila]MDW8877749.1 T4SS guanine nucleotide exchange effector RalF [Legionella pneumophila subsp. fraseri]MDW8960788.1 T4SS guanine nucleotide exchange effector RalF [Legionella pneumophila subsp. fraseri]MDW9035189.1 T4SS guanine nucleotide exchange effector RalF [Legionella pneumophila subsp. fraseri]MDW9038250.1 T4SS guanine nucleotide exchange effector RalF [Legionella pneumophila subsp. fraseri]MDW9041311.1 T4SS guanine nu
MHPEIVRVQREIIEAFNAKPKNGINKIKEICEQYKISPNEEIAEFFHQQRKNLDLEAVGDYLSGPEAENQQVLKAFTSQMDFNGQSFVEGLRTFLKTFKLPGEAQKIDRLVQNFSEAYSKQNPDVVSNADAAYLLAFQTIMLNTDLHNPSIPEKNKMTIDGLKRNLRGGNNGGDFDAKFLEELYSEIKTKPFELNFVKTSPGYELTSTTLNKDSTFKKLGSLLHSTNVNINTIFPGIGDNVKATVDQPKSWLSFFTGYKGTITLTDKQTSAQATIQVYTPNIFSKWLFGEQPRVIIQPGQTKESIDLAAKAAAGFASPVKNFKATYDYEVGDLIKAYDNQKKLITIERNLALKESMLKDPDAEMQKEKGRQLKF